MKIEIKQYDDLLLFRPVAPFLRRLLTITEKSLECGPHTKWVQQVVRNDVELFEVTQQGGTEVGVTHPGFLNLMVAEILDKDMDFSVDDQRKAVAGKGLFPHPRFDRFHDLRFSQEPLLREALSKDMSGLIGAPTRYGKTSLMVNTCEAYPDIPICITAPGVDLVQQLYDDFHGERGIKGRDMKLICTGSRHRQSEASNGITICSADSLGKVDAGSIPLLLADEPHALVTESRIGKINAFRGRRIGFGATLSGRFDGRDLLIPGVFGPVLSEITYLQAVEEGAICPLVIVFLVIEVDPASYRDRNSAYDDKLFKSATMAGTTAEICHTVIPEDWQTLIFIKHEDQADLYQDAIGADTSIAMAKRMGKKERQQITDRLRNNEVTRCLCTKIYVQGVTFPDVRVLINAEAGGNNTSAIQKPGRLAQCRPGKKCGIVIDFMFVPPSGSRLSDYYGEAWTQMCYDSKAREKAYTEKGYTIHTVHSVAEMKELFERFK